MDRELRTHLAMEIEANLAAGMSPGEARRRAGARLGSLEAAKEACRQASGGWGIATFLRDLRHGFRLVRRSPGFSAAAVLTLALGIGGTTAIGSVVEAVLLRPLPLPDPERLVILWENDRVQGTEREGASLPDYLDFREQCRSFEELAAYHRKDFTFQDPADAAGNPERLAAARVSASFFAVLGVEPLAGRAFLPAEEQPGRDGVVLLSHGLWHRRFAGDPAVVGRTLGLDGRPYAVVGVMPPEATLPVHAPELWVPLALEPQDRFRGRHILRVYGRLRPGVSRVEAQAEMDAVMSRLEAAYHEDNRGRGARVASLHADLVREVRPALRVLFGAVLAVLVVACVNVAGLLLARGAARGEDLAIRAALGAGRVRLLRQLLTESLVLAGMGAAGGLLLGAGGGEALAALAPPGIPRLSEAGFDGRLLAAAAALAVGTWLLFGLAPAWRASRAALRAELQPRSRGGGAGRAGQALRSTLVVAEVALSLALLAVSGLLARSFWELRRVDPGFAPQDLLAAAVDLPASKYPFPREWPVLDWPAGRQFADDLQARVLALPGVDSAALALYSPVEGGWTTRVLVEGRPVASLEEVEEAHYRPVGAGYFETLGMTVLAGRSFTPDDRPGVPLVAVVNQAFARRYFPAETPLGERLLLYQTSREVVGVVGDERFLGLGEAAEPTVYLPWAQNPQPSLTLLVRGDRPVTGLATELRATLRALDRDLALYDVAVIEEALAASLAERRFTLVLLAVFAATALVLAAVGLYGLLAYLVSQRRREIGLRMALGAARRQVVRLVLGRALLLALAGVVFGLGAAVGAGRAVRGLLFGVGSADPRTFAVVALVLLATAALAAWVPARRASGIDPQAALREDG